MPPAGLMEMPPAVEGQPLADQHDRRAAGAAGRVFQNDEGRRLRAALRNAQQAAHVQFLHFRLFEEAATQRRGFGQALGGAGQVGRIDVVARAVAPGRGPGRRPRQSPGRARRRAAGPSAPRRCRPGGSVVPGRSGRPRRPPVLYFFNVYRPRRAPSVTACPASTAGADVAGGSTARLAAPSLRVAVAALALAWRRCSSSRAGDFSPRPTSRTRGAAIFAACAQQRRAVQCALEIAALDIVADQPLKARVELARRASPANRRALPQWHGQHVRRHRLGFVSCDLDKHGNPSPRNTVL